MSSRVIIPVLLSTVSFGLGLARAAEPWSGASGILHQFVLERVLDRQGALQMFTGLADGRSHLLYSVIGDISDFLEGKSLDSVKNEGFAFGASGVAQGILHQADQLAASRQLFGIIGGGIGYHILLEQLLVRLMELQHGFGRAMNVGRTMRAFQR